VIVFLSIVIDQLGSYARGIACQHHFGRLTATLAGKTMTKSYNTDLITYYFF